MMAFTLGALISLALAVIDAHRALWLRVDDLLTEVFASKVHTTMLLLGILLTFQLAISLGGQP